MDGFGLYKGFVGLIFVLARWCCDVVGVGLSW